MGRRHFKDYAAFVERFVAGRGRAALEDFDARALRALKGEERAEAIEVLREHLASGANDPRAVAAWVALRPRGLLAELRRLVKVSLDETGVAAARALWRLQRDPAAARALVEIMQDSYDEAAQREAARALEELPAAEVEEALLGALDHESEEVRSAASSLLLRRAGLEKLVEEPASKVSRLRALVLNPLASVRRPAIVELKEILGALRAGQKPAALGLVPGRGGETAALDRFRRSVMSRGGIPIDTDAFAELRGEERLRAEQILYHLLSIGDARAVHAIRRLRLRAAIPVLLDAAALGEGEFARLAREAAAALSAEAAQEHEQAREDLAAASSLLRDLTQEDAAKRLRAAQMLLGLLDLGTPEPRSRLASVLGLLQSPLRSVYRRAATDLAALPAAKRAGQSPAEIGLSAPADSPALDRLTEQALHSGEELDAEALRQLGPEERPWAEYLIFHLLGQHDPRGVRAVLALGARWAVPALEELAQEQGAAAATAKKALRWLGTDRPAT